MTNKRTRRVLLSLILMAAWTLTAFPAAAQTVDSVGFTVQAVMPDNQIDSDVSYFDLLMEPGESRLLAVNVINKSSQEMTIDVVLRAASTNRNGIIEYQVEVMPDETLAAPFNTIAKTDPQIKVAANSTQTVSVMVTMPAQEYDGVILGGIVFTRRDENPPEAASTVTNQFSYVVGVKLSETSRPIQPDFKIKSIEPALINYRRAVMVNIQNPVALIVKNASITGSVYKNGGASALFTINKDDIDMAPNSVYPLPVEWENQQLAAGDYHLEMEMQYNGQTWKWSENFTIEAEVANQINNTAIDAAGTGFWFTWWWIPVLIGILLLVWLAFAMGRRRRDDEELRQEYR